MSSARLSLCSSFCFFSEVWRPQQTKEFFSWVFAPLFRDVMAFKNPLAPIGQIKGIKALPPEDHTTYPGSVQLACTASKQRKSCARALVLESKG